MSLRDWYQNLGPKRKFAIKSIAKIAAVSVPHFGNQLHTLFETAFEDLQEHEESSDLIELTQLVNERFDRLITQIESRDLPLEHIDHEISRHLEENREQRQADLQLIDQHASRVQESLARLHNSVSRVESKIDNISLQLEKLQRSRGSLSGLLSTRDDQEGRRQINELRLLLRTIDMQICETSESFESELRELSVFVNDATNFLSERLGVEFEERFMHLKLKKSSFTSSCVKLMTDTIFNLRQSQSSYLKQVQDFCIKLIERYTGLLVNIMLRIKTETGLAIETLDVTSFYNVEKCRVELSLECERSWNSVSLRFEQKLKNTLQGISPRGFFDSVNNMSQEYIFQTCKYQAVDMIEELRLSQLDTLSITLQACMSSGQAGLREEIERIERILIEKPSKTNTFTSDD